MIAIKGKFRVQSIYKGDDRSYITLKDKSTGHVLKVAMDNPINKNVVDDGLVELDGELVPSMFGNNLSVNYAGPVSVGAEK